MELTAIKGGLNRLRTKGAAPNDSLYDLLNGYVTAAKTVESRPGTFRSARLPQDSNDLSLTKGLVSFDGELHIFAIESIPDEDMPEGYVLHVIQHPAQFDVDGNPIPLLKIHFAKPFMGFLYVVAEFEEVETDEEWGFVFHYWIRTGAVWEANTVYKFGDIVLPSTPNGLAYQATRLSAPNPSWAPGARREVYDVIEPTVYNDFYYTVVETEGAQPRSGTTEPDWPTESGARIFEDADGTAASATLPTTQPDVDTVVDSATRERYELIESLIGRTL